MRYISTFSGIEAASVAWGPLGWEPVCFSEVDEFPSAVLDHRFPEVPNLGDITEVNWYEVTAEHGPADLVVGGSPCQSFSIAGTRAGLEGASGLMWEYVRCIQEVAPRWLLWENVPGCLSSGPEGQGGEDFACLLRALDDLGYGLAWRVLDASLFGVPQRRRRVFLVGRLGEGGAEDALQVLFEPEGLRWDFVTGAEKRAGLAAGSGAGAALCFDRSNVTHPYNRSNPKPGDPAPTINTNGDVFVASSAAGFKIAQGADAGSIGYEVETSPTLITGGEPGAVYAVRTANTSSNGCGVQEDVAHTLDASGPETICMSTGQAKAEVAEDHAPTLSCNHEAPIVLKVRCGSDTYIKHDGSTGTAGKGALIQEDAAFTVAATQDQTLFDPQDGVIVRRLTPKECERLQGFPDDWTRVPYKGRPAEECPDGPRYKACGNSMAVPVMRWIGERIARVDAGENLYELEREAWLCGRL